MPFGNVPILTAASTGNADDRAKESTDTFGAPALRAGVAAGFVASGFVAVPWAPATVAAMTAAIAATVRLLEKLNGSSSR